MENAAGVSLADLIDFCARCVALGIPEATKLRAVADDHGSLVMVSTERQMATLLEMVSALNAEYGTIIEGGVVIEIPDGE